MLLSVNSQRSSIGNQAQVCHPPRAGEASRKWSRKWSGGRLGRRGWAAGHVQRAGARSAGTPSLRVSEKCPIFTAAERRHLPVPKHMTLSHDRANVPNPSARTLATSTTLANEIPHV
jgi:hypothetical protein